MRALSVMIAVWSCCSALVLAPRDGSAQAGGSCPRGQRIGPDTAGHCCWPAQAWSSIRQTCVGAPQCPAGFDTQGETCAAVTIAAPIEPPRTSESVCPAGQSVSPDTAGHCCWSGQVWSATRGQCVGIPQCPAGLTAEGETCAQPACPSGQAIAPDTAGHCCWPAQVWSTTRAACIGIPQCPGGLVASGETCVNSPATAPIAANPPMAEEEPITYGAFGIPHRRRRVRQPGESDVRAPGAQGGRRQIRMGMVVGGGVAFGAGYLIAAVVAGAATAYGESREAITGGNNCNRSMGWSYVPLIGPAMSYANYDNRVMVSRMVVGRATITWTDNCPAFAPLLGAYAFLDTVVQVGGLALMAAGFVLRRRAPDQAVNVRDRSARFMVLPGAPGASLGATLMVTHF